MTNPPGTYWIGAGVSFLLPGLTVWPAWRWVCTGGVLAVNIQTFLAVAVPPPMPAAAKAARGMTAKTLPTIKEARAAVDKARAAWTAKLSVLLPNDPYLKGKTIWYQGLDFVPAKPAASHLTGAGSDVIK